MMKMMLNYEAVNPVAVLYDDTDYIVVTVTPSRCRVYVYVSKCDLALSHVHSTDKDSLREFEHVAMRLLEKGEIVPVQAIRKMDDCDKQEMSYAIELAQETLNNR